MRNKALLTSLGFILFTLLGCPNSGGPLSLDHSLPGGPASEGQSNTVIDQALAKGSTNGCLDLTVLRDAMADDISDTVVVYTRDFDVGKQNSSAGNDIVGADKITRAMYFQQNQPVLYEAMFAKDIGNSIQVGSLLMGVTTQAGCTQGSVVSFKGAGDFKVEGGTASSPSASQGDTLQNLSPEQRQAIARDPRLINMLQNPQTPAATPVVGNKLVLISSDGKETRSYSRENGTIVVRVLRVAKPLKNGCQAIDTEKDTYVINYAKSGDPARLSSNFITLLNQAFLNLPGSLTSPSTKATVQSPATPQAGRPQVNIADLNMLAAMVANRSQFADLQCTTAK